MAKITNVSTESVLFRTRNNVSYEVLPGTFITVPDAEVTYDTVDAALEAGKITVTTDAGLTFFDSYGRNPAEQQAGGGGGGSLKDREFVVTTYRVKTAFTGASVGDTVTATQVIDVTTDTPTTITTIWRNQTTAADFSSVPSASNLELIGSQALTDAQLRASAVVVSASPRTCLGRQTISVTTGAVSTLTPPVGAVAAMIQADGSAVSITLEGTAPTATVGSRIDDGVFYYVDTALSSVKLIARSTTTNVQVAYFDKA